MKTRAGFTLIELMVALAIGLLLIAGAIHLLARGQAAHGTAESVARLEESARTALESITAEVRIAGFYGDVPPGTPVNGWSAAGTPEPAALAVAGGCGASLAHDLAMPVTAADGRYALDASRALSCRPTPGGRAVAGADTLTVRRASTLATRPEAGRLQVESTARAARLVADGTTAWPGASTSHDLEVSVFYVSADSTGNPGYPSLRRKRLVGGTRPAFQDEELVAGVADLQVELGVDVRGDGDEAVDTWVPPGAVPTDGAIRAVRFWLLLQAEVPESAPVMTQAQSYANRDWPAWSDRFRRLVVAHTVALRNTVASP